MFGTHNVIVTTDGVHYVYRHAESNGTTFQSDPIQQRWEKIQAPNPAFGVVFYGFRSAGSKDRVIITSI